jgi:hypothetical protein
MTVPDVAVKLIRPLIRSVGQRACATMGKLENLRATRWAPVSASVLALSDENKTVGESNVRQPVMAAASLRLWCFMLNSLVGLSGGLNDERALKMD